MLIKSFEVRNFKSIEYSDEIIFPKLTILLGSNSSGKSSIFQPLLLMKQTFEAEESSMPLVLNGPYIKLGEFEDFIHKKQLSNSFSIKFNFKPNIKKLYKCNVCDKNYKMKKWFLKHVKNNHPKYWNVFQNKISKDEYHLNKIESLKFEYRFDSKTRTINLSELEFENPPITLGLNLSLLRIKQLKNKVVLEAISENNAKIYSKEIIIPKDAGSLDHNVIIDLIFNSIVRPYYFFNYTDYQGKQSKNENIALLDKDLGDVLKSKMREYSKKSKDAEMKNYIVYKFLTNDRSLDEDQKTALSVEYRLNLITQELKNCLKGVSMFLKGVHHVGALRSWPERIYFGTGGKPSYVGTKGEFTQEMFWLDKRIGHDKLIDKINNWLSELKFNVELEVVQVRGDIYQLNVKQNGLSINIADVGFGLSQILPIIAECLNYSSEDIQFYGPHFSRQKIGKFVISEQPEIHLNPMIQAQLGDLFIEIADSNMSLLIETHSEHIISRVQRRVADETLKPEDISIYFISKNKNKSIVKKISMSPNGTFDYWPDGFFQDDYNDSIEILKASLRKYDGE